MKRLPAGAVLVVASGLAAQACGAEDAVAPREPCAMELATSDGADAVLRGRGSCPFSVPLRLRVAVGDPENPSWSEAAQAPLRVEGAWEALGSVARRRVVVKNDSPDAVRLVALEWSAAAAALGADRFFHNGYQSWSFTGVEPLRDGLVEERGTAPHGGGTGDVLGEIAGSGWWYGAVGAPSSPALFLGAEGATVLRTYVSAERGRVRLVEGALESVTIEAGASRELDAVIAALGEPAELFDAYARAVAVKHPPRVARRPALGGWGSWNLYYDKPTAAALREEGAWAAQHLARLGLTDFLLDDGYEPHWGDWTAKPAFGSSVARFAEEHAARGLRPALWLAPFCVDVDAPLFSAHPDWLVKRPSGGVLTITEASGVEYGVLDASHPGARAHLATLLRDLFAVGYVTFKLDYLFAGAAEGVRAEAVTGIEAYQLGMKAMRDAVPEAHLIGCGAPQLASVGWVDSMRVGPDIAFTAVPEPQAKFVLAESRHSALRAHTDRWFALDPDVVLLRGAELSDEAAWSHVVSSAMTGGNYLLGDGRQTSAARLAMALSPDVLALARDGVAARPDDLFAVMDEKLVKSPALDISESARPAHVLRKTGRDGRRYVAVFAWSEPTFAVDLELAAGAEEITASGVVAVAGSGSPTRVEVQRHGARLFRMAP